MRLPPHLRVGQNFDGSQFHFITCEQIMSRILSSRWGLAGVLVLPAMLQPYYFAPTENDAAPDTLDKPFASMQRAPNFNPKTKSFDDVAMDAIAMNRAAQWVDPHRRSSSREASESLGRCSPVRPGNGRERCGGLAKGSSCIGLHSNAHPRRRRAQKHRELSTTL